MATLAKMTPVAEQWQIFLSLAVAGIALAFVFDCYRVARYYWRPGALATYAGDTLFWVLTTFLIFAFLMLINWGEVRGYVFLALGSGAGFYLFALSRHVRKILYAGGFRLARC
ncbi:MAG: hypothetical protein GX039_03985 [Clostridia bacterium]|nr:hypothetical protein [Clostridia bacterium]